MDRDRQEHEHEGAAPNADRRSPAFRVDPGRLISTAVHDLRSPLTVILSLAEIIASDPDMDPGMIEEFARSIGTKASEMRRLIETLSEVSRRAPVSPRRVEVPVDSLLQEITAPYDGRDRWTPSVDLDIADAPDTWQMDRERVRRAVVAMLDWASGSERSLLSARERDGMLEIALREYGRTAGADQLADMDRSLRGAEPSQGVGLMLGLTLAGMIAAEHGGTGGARTVDDGFEVWIRIGPAKG